MVGTIAYVIGGWESVHIEGLGFNKYMDSLFIIIVPTPGSCEKHGVLKNIDT